MENTFSNTKNFQSTVGHIESLKEKQSTSEKDLSSEYEQLQKSFKDLEFYCRRLERKVEVEALEIQNLKNEVKELTPKSARCT